MASQSEESSFCYLKPSEKYDSVDQIVRSFLRKECHAIDLNTRVCQTKNLSDILMGDTNKPSVFLIPEMNSLELKCFLRS